MIRDAQQHNENATPKDFEIGVLMEALPHYFDGDGNFRLEKFQNMLQEEQVELSRESYELNFLGKSYARLLASLETETVIVPNEEHNADERNADSENIYITGDNLDALKHLAKSYRGKVKCIYIDPPYNTGKDGFAYNDSFDFTVDSLVEQIGVTEDEAERILDLNGRSSHSAWMTFMLPRLVVGKSMLRNDGVIFISIDENEVSDLTSLADDIFGEDNRIGVLPVIMNMKGNQDAFGFAETHEYFLVYARNKADLNLNRFPIDEESLLAEWSEDSYGLYKEADNLRATGVNAPRSKRPNLWYPIFVDPRTESFYTTHDDEPRDEDHEKVFPINPDGEELSWYWKRSKVNDESYNLILKNTSNGWQFYKKQRPAIGDVPTSKPKSTFYKPSYSTSTATKQLQKLMGNRKYFNGPKPVPFIYDLVQLGSEKDSIVLDFFSGSGTTAEAIMKLNADDGGNRQYILVQIAEELAEDEIAFQDGFRTIDEIGRKRIELAADKIKQDTGADIDYGFKHYTLETPPQSVIDSLEDFAPDDNLFSDDPLESLDFDGTTADNVLLTTWIVQDGYGLNPEIEKVTLSNYELTIVGNTAYAIDGGMSSDDIRVLTQKLEDGEIDITNFVYFHTAIGFEHLRELDSALRHLRNRSSVTITARW